MSTRRFLPFIFATVWLLLCTSAHAQRRSALAPVPDWTRLEAYQERITREDFQRLLDTVYAPGGAAAGVIDVQAEAAVIAKTLSPVENFVLRFARDAASVKARPLAWRPAARLGAAPANRTLAGLRLVLDPGHLGGEWGRMEERSFQRPGDHPVQEGDLTLAVCQRAATQLRALGAEVTLVREKAGPTTPFTAEALRPAARRELEDRGVRDARETYADIHDPQRGATVQYEAERLFYRVAEIRQRARLVNTKLKPDIVVCVHFNADDWSDADNPVFTPNNDLHILIHGCYSAGELRYDDQRLDMLIKLLNGSHAEELACGQPVAAALAKATALPPFTYLGGNAVAASADGYLWARNLLANRLYECPVVFLEPYRMNNELTYARIQAGDYDGEREFSGQSFRSLIREYADAIVTGLADYYRAARR
jgi:hypothetical protein